VLFHIDAVQAIGKVAVDVEALRADALTGSGHKIYGPKGTGFLYLRKRVKLAPLVWGGGQERAFRPGTENVAGIAGLGLAAELAGQELKTEMPRLAALRNRLINGILEKVEGTALNGPTVKRVPTNANLRFDGVEGEALLQAMDLKGICVSSGSACSAGSVNPSHVLTAMGLTREEALSSVRMTLGRENTEEQIDYVLEELPQIVERLRRKAE
jgi:cysteine desulfurase